MKYLLYIPNDQFTYFAITALIFLTLISLVSFFEAWKLHDQKKSLKNKIKKSKSSRSILAKKKNI